MATDSVNIPIGLDLTGFKAGIQQVEGAFQKASGAAKQSASNTQSAFKATEKALISTESQINDITNSIRNWEREKKKATNPADIEKFNQKISEAKQNIAGIKDTTAQASTHLTNFGNKGRQIFEQLGSAIIAAFAISSIIAFGKSIINTTAEFQKFGAVLSTTLGSDSKAQSAMEMITDFAKKTPFSVKELTDSFIRLANQGFTPTNKQLTSLGDLASSTGKNFDQLAEAIIDAQVGEFERLKEFGIRAQKNGDLVKFTFKGVTTEVKNTSETIQKYILDLGNAEGVSGSMSKVSETLGGKISNLGDSWDQLLLSLGNISEKSGIISGSIDGITNSISAMATALGDERLTNFDKFISALGFSEAFGEGLVKKLDTASKLENQYLIKISDAYGASTTELKDQAIQRLDSLAKEAGDAEVKALLSAKKRYLKILEEIQDDRKKKTESAKQLTDAELEAQRKAAEEIRKINEDLYKRLRQLQVENTDGFVAQLVAKRELELEDLAKIKGNEETKFQIKLEILKKYDKEFEKYAKAQTDKATELRKKEAADAVKIENERFDGIKTRLEKHVEDVKVIKNEISAEDQNKIELANFLGIELTPEGEQKLEDFKAALKEALGLIQDYVKEALASYTELKEGQVDLKTQQIEENQRQIQIEQEQAAQGFNNNVDALMERDKKLKAERDKANEELKKAKQTEILLNSAMEASNMVLAISKLYAALSGTVVGVAVATALSVGMVAAFGASKSAALKDAKTTKYERGGSWVLEGADHANGGINLGGGREAQGRERIAIFNREATMRNSGLESFVNAINTGKLTLDKDGLGSILKPTNNIIVNVAGQKELSRIEQLLTDQGKTSSGKNYKRYGSTTTIYKN